MTALLTKKEAAKTIRVCLRTMDTLLSTRAIACIRIKGCVRIHPDALAEFLSKQTVNAA